MASGSVSPEQWVHRTAAGIEIGGEASSGSPDGPIEAFSRAVAHTWEIRKTLWLLVLRDFKVRYRAQALGVFWSLAYPLVMMVTVTIAFTYILRIGIPNFPVFFLIGVILWHFITNSMMAATNSLLDPSLVKRTMLPRLLLPISTVLSQLISLALEAVLVVLFYFAFPDAYSFGLPLLALPLLLVLLVTMALGIGFIVSGLNVRYRDTQYVVSSLVTMGFWVTPILYSTAYAPDWLRPILQLNPMAGIIEGTREIVMLGQWPTPSSLLVPSIAAVGLFAIGCAIFRRQNLEVADYV